MKISQCHMDAGFQQSIEGDFAHGAAKLERLLKKYSPDLVHLHCSVEKVPRTEEFAFSLNLTLPTGEFHAVGSAADSRTSVKAAFAELEKQVKKHQERLRKDYEWKRKRGRGTEKTSEAI